MMKHSTVTEAIKIQEGAKKFLTVGQATIGWTYLKRTSRSPNRVIKVVPMSNTFDDLKQYEVHNGKLATRKQVTQQMDDDGDPQFGID